MNTGMKNDFRNTVLTDERAQKVGFIHPSQSGAKETKEGREQTNNKELCQEMGLDFTLSWSWREVSREHPREGSHMGGEERGGLSGYPNHHVC